MPLRAGPWPAGAGSAWAFVAALLSIVIEALSDEQLQAIQRVYAQRRNDGLI